MCCLINLSAELLKAVCSVLFLLHLLVYLLYIVVVDFVTVAVFASVWSVISPLITLGEVETEIGEWCLRHYFIQQAFICSCLIFQIFDEADLDDDSQLSFAEFEHVISKAPDFVKWVQMSLLSVCDSRSGTLCITTTGALSGALHALRNNFHTWKISHQHLLE